MGLHSVKSPIVNCPICNTECKTRGLHAHLRLVHPNEDALFHLRKKVMSQTDKGDKIIFQLSHTSEDKYRYKWAGIKRDDIEFIYNLCDAWLSKGTPFIAEHLDELYPNKIIAAEDSVGDGIIEPDNEWDDE